MGVWVTHDDREVRSGPSPKRKTQMPTSDNHDHVPANRVAKSAVLLPFLVPIPIEAAYAMASDELSFTGHAVMGAYIALLRFAIGKLYDSL